MWEDLKVYKQLDKKDINPTFKQFGKILVSLIDGYSIDQTSSIIKLFRLNGTLEQAIFIEKDKGSYFLKVCTSIKPIDFYIKHKYTMLNIVALGTIMNNYRRTSYPLTREWNDLAVFLATRIKNEIERYFEKLNSYDKIIERRKEIEPKDWALENKYELLIYASIKTKNKALLLQYLDQRSSYPVRRTTQSEYLKSNELEVDELQLMHEIKDLAQEGNFDEIEKKISFINNH